MYVKYNAGSTPGVIIFVDQKAKSTPGGGQQDYENTPEQ